MDSEPKRLISRRGLMRGMAAGAATLAIRTVVKNLPSNQEKEEDDQRRSNEGIDTNTDMIVNESEIEGGSDVFSRRELYDEYGIEIFDIQPSSNTDYVVLDFARTAVDSEIFRIIKTKKNLIKIFLIDDCYLNPSRLSKSGKAEMLKDFKAYEKLVKSYRLLVEEKKKWYEENKDRMLRRKDELLAQCRLDFSDGKITQDRMKVVVEAIDYSYAVFAQAPTEEDLVNLGPTTLGVTLNRGGDADQGTSTESFIFLVARDPEVVEFVFGEEGVVLRKGQLYGDEVTNSRQPNPSDSRIKVGDMRVDKNAKDYMIKSGLTLATTLRHELTHAFGVIHPHNDEDVLEDLARIEASENDDNYWILFRTPEGDMRSYKERYGS